MSNTFSTRAFNIISEHYASNGINMFSIGVDEINKFWWEASKEDVNEWVYSYGFENWADMKQSPHVCKVWNTGNNKVLIFADFESII